MKSKVLLFGLLAVGVADWLLINLAVGPAYLASSETPPAERSAGLAVAASPGESPPPASTLLALRATGVETTPSPPPSPVTDPRPKTSAEPVVPAASATAEARPTPKASTENPPGPAPDLKPVLFRRQSAELSEEARRTLDPLGRALRTHPQSSVRVAGHTDARGSEEFNDWLSMQRALVVKAYLSSLGVRQEQVQVEAFGARRPVDPSDSEVAHDKNRRVELAIVGMKP